MCSGNVSLLPVTQSGKKKARKFIGRKNPAIPFQISKIFLAV